MDSIDLQTARHASSGPSGLARRIVDGLRKPDRAQPLPRLVDVHPGRPASGRWIGVKTVPVECVRGTASLSQSRARDFRPLFGRAPADWKFRWSRLESAGRDLAVLPPVQLLRAGGDYWVVDGHNRVALAREIGQVWIDADITELELSSENAEVASAREN
jgi:hypothetical protein